MKLKGIIANLDKSEFNRCCLMSNLQGLLDVINYTPFSTNMEDFKLEAYTVAGDPWGYPESMRAWFLRDRFVAISTKTSISKVECFEWVSPECLSEVRDYIMSLDEDYIQPSYINFEEELGDAWESYGSGNSYPWNTK